MAYETLIVEKEEDIAIVKLNRPPVKSAERARLYGELYDAFCELEKDDVGEAPLF